MALDIAVVNLDRTCIDRVSEHALAALARQGADVPREVEYQDFSLRDERRILLGAITGLTETDLKPVQDSLAEETADMLADWVEPTLAAQAETGSKFVLVSGKMLQPFVEAHGRGIQQAIPEVKVVQSLGKQLIKDARGAFTGETIPHDKRKHFKELILSKGLRVSALFETLPINFVHPSVAPDRKQLAVNPARRHNQVWRDIYFDPFTRIYWHDDDPMTRVRLPNERTDTAFDLKNDSDIDDYLELLGY